MKKVRLYHPRTKRVKHANRRDAKILIALGWEERDEVSAIPAPIVIEDPVREPIEEMVELEPEPVVDVELEADPDDKPKPKRTYRRRDLTADEE